MTLLANEAVVSIILSGLSVVIWAFMCARDIAHRAHRQEDRNVTAMYWVGLMASIGFFASAWAFGIREGIFEGGREALEVLAFIASVGRGAMFMSGVYLLIINASNTTRR